MDDDDGPYLPARPKRSRTTSIPRSRPATLRHPSNRDDMFTLPEEVDEPPQNRVPKAVRNLVRRPADPSPLKGQGVITMPTDGLRPKAIPQSSGPMALAVQKRSSFTPRTEREVCTATKSGSIGAGSIKTGSIKTGSIKTGSIKTGSIKTGRTGSTSTSFSSSSRDSGDLHDCRRYWEDILYSAYLILESRTAHDANSDKGKRFFRRVTYLKRELGRLKRTGYDASLDEPMQILKQRLSDFRTSGDRAQADEDEKLAHDLFQILIPELVFLLRSAVKARSLLDDLGFAAWRELIALMNLIVQAADLAYRWRPQPRDVFNGIKTQVFLIQKNLEKLGRQIGERIYLDEQARLSSASQERLYEEVRARREKFFARQKQAFGGGTTGVRASAVPASEEGLGQPSHVALLPRRYASPIDIDDL
ncbi:hypothetical protein DV735_g5116, partial [Chaetothyriales sp. CBS 134920]